MKVSASKLFDVATELQHIKHPCKEEKTGKSSGSDKALGVFLFVLTGLLTAGIMPILYLATAYKKIKVLPENASSLTQKTGSLAKPVINAKLFKSLEISSLEKALNATPSLVNAVNENGEPLISAAVKQGKVDLVKWLLERPGIDVNAPIARPHGRTTALHLATNKDAPLEVLQLLLEKGADPNLINGVGRAALHCAIAEGNTEAAKVLINHPATHLNLKDTNEGHFTPLLYAVYRSKKEVVEELLKKKEVDLQATDGCDFNVFHCAINGNVSIFTSRDGPAILEMLLKGVPLEVKKACFAAKDNSGKTPYDRALEKREEFIKTWEKLEGRMPEKDKSEPDVFPILIEQMKPA